MNGPRIATLLINVSIINVCSSEVVKLIKIVARDIFARTDNVVFQLLSLLLQVDTVILILLVVRDNVFNVNALDHFVI